jgi:hypothetical protein
MQVCKGEAQSEGQDQLTSIRACALTVVLALGCCDNHPQVYVAKPRSSRNSSIESFVVCRHFLPPPGIAPSHLRALLAGGTVEQGAADEQVSAVLRGVRHSDDGIGLVRGLGGWLRGPAIGVVMGPR